MADRIPYEKPRLLDVLKPCPFCGGKAEVVWMPYIGAKGMGLVVECDRCWANTGYYDTREEAIAAWNRREGRAMSAEVCEKCCKWVGDHEGKSPQSVADDYPKMMAYVLKHEFNMPKKAAIAFIENACSGNWERFHETYVEKEAQASEYADMLRGDVWYCSDRWSWDRVIRIQWLYQRLLDRVRKEVAEQ